MFGFLGSIAISETPVSFEIKSVLSQFFPPSIDLYTPRSPPALQTGPYAATQIIFSSVGCMIILPICSDDFNPILVKLFPPSIDL